MPLCRAATDGPRRARMRLYCSACNYGLFLEPCRLGRRLLPVVALVQDLPGEHGRLDDPAYDGRRLADVALVPRERRTRRAHPVQAAQQVLVAPRVQVVICGINRRKKKGQPRDKSTTKVSLHKGEQSRADGEAMRHMYAGATTRLPECGRIE